MEKATLVGLDEDGAALVIAIPSGEEFCVPIDDALRAAVRFDRPAIERAKVIAGGELRPREIQAQVRAGASPEDLAQSSGMDLEHIMRFAVPVLDERAYVAGRAVDLPVALDADAPTIGVLVRRRLLEAGVPPEDISFDAVRTGRDWYLIAHFGERAASWLIDLADRTCVPRDEAARRLILGGELGLLPTRHLTAVQPEDSGARTAHPSAGMHPSASEPMHPADLLQQLDEARGVRLEVLADDEPPSLEQHRDDALILPLDDQRDLPTIELPTDSPLSHPSQGALDDVDEGEAPAEAAAPSDDDGAEPGDETPGSVPPPVKPATRPKRASVPSWDEIVFGAKPE